MCSLGNLIANGGSGMHPVKYGTVNDCVLDLEVVMPDGGIIHTGCKAPKTSASYDLTRLSMGSEGTPGTITKARLRVILLPEARSVIVAAFGELEDAGNTAVGVLTAGVSPEAVEIMDGSAIRAVKKYQPSMALPDAEAMLVFELDGYRETIARESIAVVRICRKHKGRIRIITDRRRKSGCWSTRSLVSMIISRLNPGKVSIYEAEDASISIPGRVLHTEEN